jgi:hypothetical protein
MSRCYRLTESLPPDEKPSSSSTLPSRAAVVPGGDDAFGLAARFEEEWYFSCVSGATRRSMKPRGDSESSSSCSGSPLTSMLQIPMKYSSNSRRWFEGKKPSHLFLCEASLINLAPSSCKLQLGKGFPEGRKWRWTHWAMASISCASSTPSLSVSSSQARAAHMSKGPLHTQASFLEFPERRTTLLAPRLTHRRLVIGVGGSGQDDGNVGRLTGSSRQHNSTIVCSTRHQLRSRDATTSLMAVKKRNSPHAEFSSVI